MGVPLSTFSSSLTRRKLHPVLGGVDTKSGTQKNYCFSTFGSPIKQIPRKKWFFTQFAAFI